MTKFELTPIVWNYALRYAKSAYNSFPQELGDIVRYDSGQSFCFHLVGEVIYSNNDKLYSSFT